MKRTVFGFAFVVGLVASNAAFAEGGRWNIFAEDGSCEISFVDELVDDGILAIDRFGTCGPSIDQITGYALNEEGAVVIFYSTLSGVELVGQVTREQGNEFKGTLRKGGTLRLEHRSGTTAIVDPIKGAALPEPDEVPTEDTSVAEAPSTGPCLAYAGQADTCAVDADLGPTESGEMQLLTRLNLRNIPGTDGSSVIGRIESGTCLQVNLCMEDSIGRLWCGVSSDAGEGFLLKQDDKTVYARNACQ